MPVQIFRSKTPDKLTQSASHVFFKWQLFLLIISAAFLILATTSFFIIHTILNSPAVYRGVTVDGLDVSGYTRDELRAYLDSYYGKLREDVRFTVFAEDFQVSVTAAQLDARIDTELLVEKAMAAGREGSPLTRLEEILRLRQTSYDIPLSAAFDQAMLGDFIQKVYESGNIPVVPYELNISDSKVVLYTGTPGREVDTGALQEDLSAAVLTLRSASIQVIFKEIKPLVPELSPMLDQINQDAADAQFVKISRTEYTITPHVIGRWVDPMYLAKLLSGLNSDNPGEPREIELPLTITTPYVTEESLKASLFRDDLSTFATRFNQNSENNRNRAVNIGLASKSIDGTLLLPGETFSFNEVVGPRTTAKGYKIAHVFVAGQIQDGTGGGICQVSTTLYNAALRANLEVLERHNHMFTVGYVPLGTDAAVSYGYADLVFKNTTSSPLKIRAIVTEDNRMIFSLLGTNAEPGIHVKLVTELIKTVSPPVEYREDWGLPNGTVIVEDEGQSGAIVDTYIKVYNGESLIKEVKLGRSVYQAIPRKLIRGAQAY